MIYHLIPKSEWEKVKNGSEYAPESLEKDGYVHFSLLEQLIGVTYFLYKDCLEPVLVLEVDEKKLKPNIVFEDNRGHGRYPHAYGPINLDAVVRVYDLEKTTGKSIGFKLPRQLHRESIDLKNTEELNIL